ACAPAARGSTAAASRTMASRKGALIVSGRRWIRRREAHAVMDTPRAPRAEGSYPDRPPRRQPSARHATAGHPPPRTGDLPGGLPTLSPGPRWSVPPAAMLPRGLVHLGVRRDGAMPAEVPGHRVADALLPGGAVPVEVDRVPHRLLQRPRLVLVEEEPGDAVLDGVREPAHAPDHGERAVALGPELRQAARLVERGHEEEIGGAQEAVLALLGELEAVADPVRCRRGEPRDRVLVARLSLAEDRPLRVEPRDHPCGQEDVEPLLLDEARADREQGHVRIRREAEPLLE